jgi:hypothetical protein
MAGNGRVLRWGTLVIFLITAIALTQSAFIQGAWAQEKAMNLFKIITVKDEIVVGLSADELGKLGGQDAGAIAKALVSKGEMTVWQYAVRKNSNGDLEQAPLHQVGLLANNSLRVEPYSSPLKVLPHE